MVVEGTPGSGSKLAGVGREVALCHWLDFDQITKMPLEIIPKLL
jgi:hypothetical protein